MTECSRSEPSQSGVSTASLHVKDPAIGVYVFCNKHLPRDGAEDPRLNFLTFLETASRALELNQKLDALHASLESIRLIDIARSGHGREILVNWLHDAPDTRRQAIGFTFLDALVAQV